MDALIEINPKIMMGKPVLRGTRITVELVLERLGAGESVDEILDAYPHLNRESILAAIPTLLLVALGARALQKECGGTLSDRAAAAIP